MSNTEILIADADTERAQRVANALESAGHRCCVADQGAAALEVALAEQPRVVVAQVDLPLVDAGKLAEIMRANPHTRAVRFLFLGVVPAGDLLGQIGDATLDASAEADVVLEAVATLIDRQQRIEQLEARASIDLEFSGALSEVSPVELIQMLHLRGATGRVVFESDEPGIDLIPGELSVQNGEIFSAEIGPIRAEKALFRMLQWSVGRYEFKPGNVEGEAEITAPTRSVLAEGLRQLDQWNRLAPELPPLESPVRLCVHRRELPHIVHPLTQEVLELLEEHGRVSDVVDHCHYTDYQVLRTLHTLCERGIVALGSARIAPSQSLSQGELFNEAQCRRLRGFVQRGLARDIGAPDAKLIVVAASQMGLQRFVLSLAKVPGVEMSARFERGEVGAEHLETMGRVDVDGGFCIELIHLPAAEIFAPLWPLAGHGALGTVVLLDAEIGASTSHLSAITDTLVGGPSARTFHVVMLGEGERLSSEDLRDNLSLLDEGSLFVLPSASGKDADSLLRSLFARIVP
jgi:CheY-like chemotaxis protein